MEIGKYIYNQLGAWLDENKLQLFQVSYSNNHFFEWNPKSVSNSQTKLLHPSYELVTITIWNYVVL